MRAKSLECVYELAKRDPRVVYIGSDVGVGTLDNFKKEMPDRFFVEGISEAHVIGMAAGLAKAGYIPYVNTIATFLTRRCYEQIAIDVCLQNLPVRLIANGGGLVYAPLGPTHMAIEDIGLMRLLPNMQIIAPCDAAELEKIMMESFDAANPMYIRIAKGDEPEISNTHSDKLRKFGKILLITTGVMAHQALKVVASFEKENISCGFLHLPIIKPIDKKLLMSYIKNAELIVTIEEHVKEGGLGSSICEMVSDCFDENFPKVIRLGLPSKFVEYYGSQEELFHHYELDASGIEKVLVTYLAGKEIFLGA